LISIASKFARYKKQENLQMAKDKVNVILYIIIYFTVNSNISTFFSAIYQASISTVYTISLVY